MSQSSPSTLWQTIPDDQLVRLLDRSHTLNGAVLLGLDGLMIEIQARAMNVDLPEHKEGDFIIVGELGLHGEVRRVPGVLSLAYMAKAGQKLIVPTGNEKAAALILAKPGHEGCGGAVRDRRDAAREFLTRGAGLTRKCTPVHSLRLPLDAAERPANRDARCQRFFEVDPTAFISTRTR